MLVRYSNKYLTGCIIYTYKDNNDNLTLSVAQTTIERETRVMIYGNILIRSEGAAAAG